MNVPKTYTVERCYQTASGWHVVLNGRALSFRVDEKIPVGAAVRIDGNRAVRA